MKLADYMASHGLTPEAMKDRLGCSEGAVRKWLYGERTPSPEWMRKIAAATDGAVQPNDFFAPAAPSTEDAA